MQWIESFERLDGAPHLKVVTQAGARSFTPFRQLRSVAPEARGARYVDLSGISLDAFSEHAPGEFLELLGFDAAVSANHRVYELRTPTARLLIPAAVMMLGIFARIWHLAPWLVSAATLDMLAVPTFSGDRPAVTFFPGSISGGRDGECTQDRFLWLTNFPSARRSWNSVARHVSAGRLGVDMPQAVIHGSARGLSRGDTILVTRLHINRLRPTEKPVPSAASLEGRSFRVSARTDAMSGQRPDTLGDETLPLHAAGSRLTDEEWTAVLGCLDVRSLQTGRSRIDEILL
ncbi:MAG: hypothetical protein ABUU24_04280, partial [Variovorax sp.]